MEFVECTLRVLVLYASVCLCSRYQPIKVIGKGAYGVVCSATDVTTNETVAVKKIAGVFSNVLDARRTFREIRILRCLRHENIIAVKNVLTPRDANNFGDMYVVYELMDTDLQHIIHSRQPLSDEHCQYFVYQVRREMSRRAGDKGYLSTLGL